jgi:antitoxin CptB
MRMAHPASVDPLEIALSQAPAQIYKAPMPPLTELDIRRKKALFRAQRRGFRELDLVFAGFADAHLEKLDALELAAFEALLDVPDWDIFGWIMGHEPVPALHDHGVFARLAAYRTNLSL